MTSDLSIKDQFLSKMMSRLSNPLSFLQSTAQGEGASTSMKQINAFSHSSINLPAGSDCLAASGHTSSSTNLTPPTRPRRLNVVLFGETGVGKSSVINLIAQRNIAKVSSDVNGCTMQSTPYDISFDDMDFTIFDTIGLEEPQMGVNGYLKAIEKAYELIARLGNAGGIHLLLFCMRGGRITATTQSNYRLFCECLCSTKVPIALVFTGLEREVKMEDWWDRNKTHVEYYGIKSDGHVCITAVQDDTPEEVLKYKESQTKIRELLKTCALKHEAFCPEQNSWFAKFGKGMRSFIEKHRNPKKRDIMRVLTHRCKLDPETARKIADMMEKGDQETKESNQEEQTENTTAEGGTDPAVGKDVDKGMKNNTELRGTDALERSGTRKEVARATVTHPQHETVPPAGPVEAGPHTVGKDKVRIASEKVAYSPLPQPQNEPARSTVELVGKDKAVASKATRPRAPAPPQKDPELVSRTQKPEKVTYPTSAHSQHGVEIVRSTIVPEVKDKTRSSNEKSAKRHPPQNASEVRPRKHS